MSRLLSAPWARWPQSWVRRLSEKAEGARVAIACIDIVG